MNRCTETIVDIHGIRWYYPEICVDGGVFRAKNTYTNLTFPSGSFKHTRPSQEYTLVTENFDSIVNENNIPLGFTIPASSTYNPMPYSGHFYGIRKYTGLAPNLPYNINITGKSGSSKAINIPTEIIELEYNKNENYGITNDYTGFRFSDNIDINGQFGRSIASKQDLLAIGCPKSSVTFQNKTYTEAGSVFLYRRNPRPVTKDWPIDNYKSSWILETKLTLPSGFISDYYKKDEVLIGGLSENFKGVRTSWFVGQNGRQFGHSLDLSINSNKKSLGENKQEILVVGGVGAKWDRTFDEIPVSGVSVGLFIFTDEFQSVIPTPTIENPLKQLTYQDILYHIYGKDEVFYYFSDPRVKFDVKIIVCVPTLGLDVDDPTFPDKPDFITLKRISKNYGYPLSEESISGTLDGIKSAFLETFPYSNALNSGIPPIIGLCFDGSLSMGGREALEPAVDRFLDFYKDYSFASGLKDFYGIQSSGIVYEVESDSNDTNWINMSKLILNDILDTGNLVKNDQVRFFSNNVGTFNGNDKDFNVPPDSGGKVFIFEKESGCWNLIQAINSPNVTREYNDRFGHDVAISDDGEVIVVGSPYINQAVTVYERNYEARDRFYYELLGWIQSNRPEKYSKELEKYSSKLYPNLNDVKALYLSMDQDDKFQSRIDLGIEEYQNVYTYDYKSIQPIGSWSFIANEHAPTSRLGYSVATNEDGSIVVAGAPTDSLNFYNDADVYYSFNSTFKGKYYGAGYVDPSGLITGPINSSWSSSLYAGSAHVFESRKYYPHSRAIEYGRFGNLHENISNNTPDSGHFDYISQIFSDKNFVKTDFENSEIPMDAGLVFIITPAVNALSDEVVDNIKNWLALGDRNLVLVGNDPRWESNGIYGQSNIILNNLLEKLQSRMRIVPARNEYESLPSGYTSFNNIVPSVVPQGSTYTYVKRLPARASGVADIKIFFNYEEQMSCKPVPACSLELEKTQIQTRCEMPLRNYGDLRASWNDLCCKSAGGTLFPVIYSHNWPLIFGSYAPDCDDVAFESKPTKNQEPIPLLVAAEKVKQEIIYPAVPASSGYKIIYENIFSNSLYTEFGSPVNEDKIDFSYGPNSKLGIDYNSIDYNITNTNSNELFYKPSDDLGGLLQVKGSPKIDIVPYLHKEEISDKGYFALEYSYNKQLSSKINIISNLEIESKFSEGASDSNILFYKNLASISNVRFGEAKIAQLNWNGNASFAEAYPESQAKNAFRTSYNLVQNVSMLDSTYNVAFLPGINAQPSDENIQNLIQWLSFGNKRLIVTCYNTISSIIEAKKLCNTLGINLELLTNYNNENISTSFGSLSINQNHQIGGKNFTNTRLNTNLTSFNCGGLSSYVFKLNQNAIPLAYINDPIYDYVPKEYNKDSWDMNAGIVKVNVPVLPGSGYRLFINSDALDTSETISLTINVEDVSLFPKIPYPDLDSISISELDKNREIFESKKITSLFYGLKCNSPIFKDIQVGNTDNINIYISCAEPRLKSDYAPKSVRLLGISGVLIPIYEKISTSSIEIPVGAVPYRISDPIDESREIIDVVRTISTDNTKYCRSGCEFLGNQLIEDGPVVAAQELEIFSSFDAGFARSRVTVITDSSIVQGRYLVEADGTIVKDTYDFIRSLYPETQFFSQRSGRQFDVYNKLISPERGSPAKYHSRATNLGLNKNFGNFVNAPSAPINVNESQYIPKYINRPKLPWQDEIDPKKIEEIKNQFISGFLPQQIQHSTLSRISGIIDGTSYSDVTVMGGVPQILKDKGYDYLDFDKFPSGYPGDLFGYSVAVKGKKILVGSPFSAFNSEIITPWSNNVSLQLGSDGGAGSVYMFEKSSDSQWINSNKFRPQSLMGQLSGVGIYSDHFGHSVDMQNDVIIVGSPNHSYGNYYNFIYNNGSFSRKNFNPQFDIPDLKVYDLGYSGIRTSLNINNAYSKNAGAIYVYENKIMDWENKKQSWVLVEKLVSNPYNPALAKYFNGSGERFGSNVYITRPYRTDADYSIFAGCGLASGISQINVGASYAKDIMLRSQKPSIPSSAAWISAKVFGNRDANGNPTVVLNFNNIGDSKRYYASGIVVANQDGTLFIEVSGQDPSTKGFISHRPYIESIYGHYQYGKLLSDSMSLYTSGGYVQPTAQMPLIIDVENSAYVYNTLGLYSAVQSGITSAGLNLFAEFPSGISLQYLNLYSSGTGSQDDNLNLSIRGK